MSGPPMTVVRVTLLPRVARHLAGPMGGRTKSSATPPTILMSPRCHRRWSGPLSHNRDTRCSTDGTVPYRGRLATETEAESDGQRGGSRPPSQHAWGTPALVEHTRRTPSERRGDIHMRSAHDHNGPRSAAPGPPDVVDPDGDLARVGPRISRAWARDVVSAGESDRPPRPARERSSP